MEIQELGARIKATRSSGSLVDHTPVGSDQIQAIGQRRVRNEIEAVLIGWKVAWDPVE